MFIYKHEIIQQQKFSIILNYLWLMLYSQVIPNFFIIAHTKTIKNELTNLFTATIHSIQFKTLFWYSSYELRRIYFCLLLNYLRMLRRYIISLAKRSWNWCSQRAAGFACALACLVSGQHLLPAKNEARKNELTEANTQKESQPTLSYLAHGDLEGSRHHLTTPLALPSIAPMSPQQPWYPHIPCS